MSSLHVRVPALGEAEMSEEQRLLAAEIGGARRGVVGGPFAIWLRTPDIAKRMNAISERLRKGSRFEKRLVELLVLVNTKNWKAQYAWSQHVPQAIAEGITPEAVEAIRTGAKPTFARDDERLIYDIFTELDARSLSDDTYARGVAHFGLELMIELITTAGLYTMISMMLVAFDVPASNGERTLA